MIGYAFMGARTRTRGATSAHIFDLPLEPEMAVICGRNADAVAEAAAQLAGSSHETDWRRVIERDDIGLVDISTPVTATRDRDRRAARPASTCCARSRWRTRSKKPRRWPQPRRRTGSARDGRVQLPARSRDRARRRLIADGRLGTIRHVRAVYLQDWIVDPEFPLVWRLQQDRTGSGALGDIGAHIVDLTQHLLADTISTVNGLTETFIKQRPLPEGRAERARSPLTTPRSSSRASPAARSRRSKPRVSRPDARTALRLEINGSLGSLTFDLERLNELELYESGDGTAGFRRDPGDRGRIIRGSVHGGRPATSSAGSTRSPTRPATC